MEKSFRYGLDAPVFDNFAHSLYPPGMLTYLSGGERRYGENPVRIYARPYWEFQAVHAGAITPTFPGAGDGTEPAEHTLWIFPPGLEHGWTGEKGKDAEISVFHFDNLADPAASFIRKLGYLKVPLEDRALCRIAALREELSDTMSGRDPLAMLKFDAACIELAILALSALGQAQIAPLLDKAELVAAGADAWYSEHMAEHPSVATVAWKMNCSASHFRRLYHEARGCSPSFAFEALRLRRARELLGRRDTPIKEIATLCGYDSISCFSRAFKRAEGSSPRNFQQ